MKGKDAAGPMQDIGVRYLLDVHIKRIEEATACVIYANSEAPMSVSTTTCPITISKGHVTQRCRALYEPESSHKKVDGTMARKWGNLQDRLC